MGDVKGKLYLNASGKKPRRPKTLDIMPADGTATEPGPHTSTSPHLNTVRTLGILHELQVCGICLCRLLERTQLHEMLSLV